MGIKHFELPDDLPQQVVDNMKQRSVEAGTTLTEMIRRGLGPENTPIVPDTNTEDL